MEELNHFSLSSCRNWKPHFVPSLLQICFLPFVPCCLLPLLSKVPRAKSALTQGAGTFPGLPLILLHRDPALRCSEEGCSSCPGGGLFCSALGTTLAALPCFGCCGPGSERVRLHMPISSRNYWFLQHNWALLLLSHSVSVLWCFYYLPVTLISILSLDGKLVPLCCL